MDGSDLPLLENITGEEGGDEQHDAYEDGPGLEYLLLGRVASWMRQLAYMTQ